jgi:DNA-binding MarR family transcriptional regulator
MASVARLRSEGGEADALRLADLLAHASRRLRRASAAELAPLGLTLVQARVLRQVARSEPVRMADIAAELEVVARSATSLVDALEHAGVVARRGDPGDRRAVLVELTPAGRALLGRLDEARRAFAEELFGVLSDAERAQLADLLGALCERSCCPSCGAEHDHPKQRRSSPGARP